MRILHLLSTNSFSGAENVACQIVSMFEGNKAYEFTYCSPIGQIQDALSERNISFEPILKLTTSEVKKVIAKLRPDVIHAHDMRASFVGAKACGNIKLISHIHNSNLENKHINLKTIAFLYAAAKSQKIIWVSTSSFNSYLFKWIFKKKSIILYNTIDSTALIGKALLDNVSYNYDVVYVGRLSKPKNPLRLLRVLSLAIQKKNNMRIAIVGDGELKNEVIEEWHRLELENNIDLLGFKSNPVKLMQSSKVMILTSLCEGTPMCALEAMALGLPIVSTPTDGMVDLIEDGVNGYLSNSDEELASHLVDISANQELHNALSHAMLNRSLIQNDTTKYKAIIEDLYLQ